MTQVRTFANDLNGVVDHRVVSKLNFVLERVYQLEDQQASVPIVTKQAVVSQLQLIGLLGPFGQPLLGQTSTDPQLQSITSGTVTSLTAGTGITLTPNPIVAAGTVALSNTAVTPGSYTYASITVDAQGRLTAASSGAAPTGTVTSVSVVTANGFAGTVATATTTPAITLTTTISGVLKGDGTAISAAASADIITALGYTPTNAAVVPNTAPAAGRILVGNAGGTAYAPVAMSGDATLASTGAITLASTITAAGPVGDATHVPQITYDAKGRLTTVASVLITGTAPGGSAGGDLSGTYPNPTVAKINGVTLGTTTATSGNVLVGSGSQWATQTISGSGATITLSNAGVITISAIANASLTNSAITINGTSVSLGGTRTLTLASADFANQGTTTTVLHGNAAGNPSFGQIVNADITNATIDLTAKVTGTLPVANGGTGAATLTSSKLLKGNGTSAVTASVITDDGTNIGIGVASPVEKLDVDGSINLKGGFNLTWGGSFGANIPAIIGVASGSTHLRFYPAGSTSGESVRITDAANVKIGGTANRGTTEGTKQLVLFDGTAPAGTLANGASFFSASGEMKVIDSAGNITLLSPHDSEGHWIHDEINFRGRHLRVDMERMILALDKMLGGGYVYIG